MNKQLNEKINQTEQLITDAKLALKSWANQIGKHHTQLKELTNQLATLKKQLNTMNMKENNKKINSQGGKK